MELEFDSIFTRVKIPRSTEIHLSILDKCSETFLSKYFIPEFFAVKLSALLISKFVFHGNKMIFKYFIKNFAHYYSICLIYTAHSMISDDNFIIVILNDSTEDWIMVEKLDEDVLRNFGFTYCPIEKGFALMI